MTKIKEKEHFFLLQVKCKTSPYESPEFFFFYNFLELRMKWNGIQGLTEMYKYVYVLIYIHN